MIKNQSIVFGYLNMIQRFENVSGIVLEIVFKNPCKKKYGMIQ